MTINFDEIMHMNRFIFREINGHKGKKEEPLKLNKRLKEKRELLKKNIFLADVDCLCNAPKS